MEERKARLLAKITREGLIRRVIRLFGSSPYDREELAARLLTLGVPSVVIAKALDEIKFRIVGLFTYPTTFYVAEDGSVIIDPIMLQVAGRYDFLEDLVNKEVETIPLGKEDGIIIPDSSPVYLGVTSVDLLDSSKGFDPLEVEVDGKAILDIQRYIDRNKPHFERAQFLNVNIQLPGDVKPVIL